MRPIDPVLEASLSAVMDGAATAQDWARVNAAWATDAGLRERWAAWHAAGDGLRCADLTVLHREPAALLAALHAQMPASAERIVMSRPVSSWLPPLAVAASFVALALGLGPLRTPSSTDGLMAQAPATTWLGQGLDGASFAQTAAGRTLPPLAPERDSVWLTEPASDIAAWDAVPPSAPASGRSSRHLLLPAEPGTVYAR
jgi:negative regulator of sigma E activity